MKKYEYFAVFEPTRNGKYSAYFPDLPGCISTGKNFKDAAQNASEALSLHLWGMLRDGDPVPDTTSPPFEEVSDGSLVGVVTAYPELIDEKIRNQVIKTNVKIPAWLKSAAESAGLNYSEVLQSALMERLGIQ